MQEPPPKRSENLFFRLAVIAGSVFAVTVLAMIVTVIKPTGSPLHKFLDEHAMKLIVGEVVATLVMGLLALTVDRHRQLAEMNADDAAAPDCDTSENTDV